MSTNLFPKTKARDKGVGKISSVVAWGNVCGCKDAVGGLMIGGGKGIRKSNKWANKNDKP